MASKTIFPIETATSCQLKWVWSTLHLNTGITQSCHRTSQSELTADNFLDFHNTESKKQDRIDMLAGRWPEKNCGYCRSIEQSGGISDRIRQKSVAYEMPPEILQDTRAINVTPSVVEVYFNNTCNLACVYCGSHLSSQIEAENRRYGEFKQGGVWLRNSTKHYKDLVPYFWQWFETGFPRLSRLNILGGEPLLQKEMSVLLDKIESTPNPNCILTVVTNLAIDHDDLRDLVARFKTLLAQHKLQRIDITCSIDCWGPQQEYVRWPLDLDHWQKNFEFLLENRWLYVNINQTISVLTIKTMPELLRRLHTWRQHRHIGHWFSEVDVEPDYLKPYILGGEVFTQDFAEILSLMPRDSEEDTNAFQHMQGIYQHISSHDLHRDLAQDLYVYLNEKDRRRGTNWRETFPWLGSFEHVV